MLTKYNGETMRWVYGLAFFLVVIGLSRFLGFPPNFTPIIAGAVFLPFICRGITFSLLPVLVMFRGSPTEGCMRHDGPRAAVR